MLETTLLILAGLSLVTFLLFGWDKRRARKSGWRTPEATLLLFSWLGGFVGGWWGMNWFRHKTKKTSFRVKMVVATLLSPAWVALWLAIRA